MSEEQQIPPQETAAPEAPKPAPAKKKVPKDDLDFDNFSVEKDRANDIRDRIQKIKETGWVEELRLLVTELGVSDAGNLPAGRQLELSSDAPAKAYIGAAENGLEGFSVTLEGTDIVVRWRGKVLLETMQLPKAGEFAFLKVEDDLLEVIPVLRECLAADTKLARQAKHDRQAHFKGFGKQ